MDLKQHMSKWNGKMTKERWLFLLCIGVILMILAFPAGNGGGFSLLGKKTSAGAAVQGKTGEASAETAVLAKNNSEALAAQIPQTARTVQNGMSPGTSGGGAPAAQEAGAQAEPAAAKVGNESLYEAQLEARVKEILKNADGVGKVDVMIVLKSSEEKVYRVDKNTSTSDNNEKDSQGGLRTSQSIQLQESTVMAGGGSSQGSAPFLEKELRPEISGIVVSAQGGGSPVVKAEISAALEALFGLPPHKIEVLKRVE